MNILIIEDEPLIADAIEHILCRLKGVNLLDKVFDFSTGKERVLSGIYDVVLVDIELSGEYNGLDLCALIRERYPDLPLLVITSLNSLRFLEQAFDVGVNDYITKPFHPKELLLRVQRWMGQRPRTVWRALKYEELVYDQKRHLFFYRGKELALSKRNKHLLKLFLERPEELLSPLYLKEKFWGDYTDRSRNLRSSIQSLRQALQAPCADWIQTVRGEGYVLKKSQSGE